MPTNIQYTVHAAKRSQQRGISECVIGALIEFGSSMSVRDQGESLYFTKKSLKVARSELPKGVYQQVEKQKNAYLVIGEGGAVITVAWSGGKRVLNS